MGSQFSDLQSANILPPRQPIGFTLDNTSRRKDLGALDLGGRAVAKGGAIYLTLYATVTWWFRMSQTDTGTVDETALDAATAPLTFQANGCIEVQAYQPVDIRVERLVDRYLIVKGSAAGTMRGWASSDIVGDSA